MNNTLSTHTARLSFVVGRDENRLAVFDEHGEQLAERSFRPTTYDSPGPSGWDYELTRIGFARVTQWTPDAVGFRCTVERIVRENLGGGVSDR